MPAKRYPDKNTRLQAWKKANRKRWEATDPYDFPGTKYCPVCKKDLPRTSFSRALANKDGLQWKCIDCIFTSHAEDPRIRMVANAKIRAAKKGLEFDLSVEDIVVPDMCPVLGIKLLSNRGRQNRDSAPTLDRIDNNKGYTKGNVRVISYRANTLKTNSTIEELEKVLADMKLYARSAASRSNCSASGLEGTASTTT